MIESPLLQRFAANQERKGMVGVLIAFMECRLGSIPDDLVAWHGFRTRTPWTG